MRILCLHGRGSNNEIFKLQTASIRADLDDMDFEFVQGTVLHTEGNWSLYTTSASDLPLYGYYNPLSAQSVLEAEESLLELIEKEGPFDGVLGYSAGAALAAQIICSDAEKFPFKSPEERPFRFACFVNAISPLKVFKLDDEEVQDGVIDVDSVTNPLVKEALDEFLRPSATRARKSFHKAADMPDSEAIRQEVQSLSTRLLADGTPFFTDGVLGMTRYDVHFHGTLINMPTLHIRCPESGDAHNNGAHTQALCESELAKEIHHPFGHDFPRGHKLLKNIMVLCVFSADTATESSISSAWNRGSWLLAAVLGVQAVLAAENITSDSYFYGQSPPVYPSPNGTGSGDWGLAYQKAEAFVTQLTQDESINLTAGVTLANNNCSGNVPPIDRLGFPGMCVNNAGNGLMSEPGVDFASNWASGIHVGASWNRELARQQGYYMSGGFRAKGVNMMLGPLVGALGRVATGGRNWEGFAADPYLSGALVYETVHGVQSQGVGACTKHFIAYKQETNREPEDNDQGEYVKSVSSNLDDQTMHELYLWPFQDAILAGSASVMCSYNRINNSYACQNSKTLNGLLKTELGFQGYVMSDWEAQHAGVASANAGRDVAMPDSSFWNGNLTQAIANGRMAASRLDDMITRLMATWYYLGQDTGFPYPGIGIPGSLSSPHQRVISRIPAENPSLWQAAVEGHVLLKNVNNALPLKSPLLLSVFGYDARGDAQDGAPFDVYDNSPYRNGTLYVGGGSGTDTPAYLDTPYAALQRQAYKDFTALQWDFETEAPTVDTNTDACLVFINAWASESYDHAALWDEYSDTLVANVADSCANTMVIMHNAGIRLVGNWANHPNVTAIIAAHLPGQDTGGALVDILYGRANPSGKLPYTMGLNQSNYGSLALPSQPEGIYWQFPQSDFTERMNIDYRCFEAYNITPQYPFGYGLSYTTFNYSKLASNWASSASYAAYPVPFSGPTPPGGNPALFEKLATVTVVVENTGDVQGQEVAQLYLGIPNAPVRQLRGFDKVLLGAGQSARVSFTLTRRDLSIWDVTAQDWLLQNATFILGVGGSSRDLPLSTTFSLGV